MIEAGFPGTLVGFGYFDTVFKESRLEVTVRDVAGAASRRAQQHAAGPGLIVILVNAAQTKPQ